MNRMKWNIEKEIMVDMERGDIWVKSGEKLTGAELHILILLRRREGKPVTADMLADQVDPLDFSCSNARFHIFNLRRKLGHCQERQVIENGKGGLSPRSVNYQHRIIHEALKHATQWQLVNRNVADAVVPPRFKSKEMNALSKEEALAFLNNIKDHRDYPIIYTAVFTGMRQGELLGLRWMDVDLVTHTIYVRQQLQYLPGQGNIFKAPKTEKSRRQIPMGNQLVQLFKDLRKQQAQERLIQGQAYQDYDLVFCLENGKPLDARNLGRRFKQLVRKYGHPEIRFHDLRHTSATLFLAAGVDAKKVQDILGHESIRTTLDVYGHVLPSMQRDAVDRLNDFMGQ